MIRSGVGLRTSVIRASLASSIVAVSTGSRRLQGCDFLEGPNLGP